MKVVPLPVNARVEVNAPGLVVEVGSACPSPSSGVVVAGRVVVAVDPAVAARFAVARVDTWVVLAGRVLVPDAFIVVVVSEAMVVVVGDGVVVVVVGCATVVVVELEHACARSTDP